MVAFPKPICEIHSIGAETRERLFVVPNVPELAEFGIRLAGISEAAFGFSWCRLHPVNLQILAGLDGEGEVWLDGRWQALKPGEAYLSPAEVSHAYRARRGTPWTVCWVVYEAEPPAFAGVIPGEPRVIPLPAGQLRHSLEGACDAVARQAEPARRELWTRLIHLTVLEALGAGLIRDRAGRRLGPLWSRVNADLARPWTLDLLAQAAMMSKENLRRVCLRETGASPMRQLTRLRMRRALELLLASDEKLVSVAERVGYTDPFAFSVAFKRETGSCPSQYRKGRGGEKK